MSTNFNNSEILPPKLRYKLMDKMEFEKNSEASSSPTANMPKSSLSSTINDNKSEASPPEKCKSAFIAKYNDEINNTTSSKGNVDPDSSSKEKGESSSRAKTRKSSKPVVDDDVDNSNWTSKIPFCNTYYPTEEEFKDPIAYLDKITSEAAKFGICKIVPPVSTSVPTATMLTQIWKPKKIKAECLPLHTGYREKPHKYSRSYTNIEQFQKLADEFYMDKYQITAQLPPSIMENDFWKRLSQRNSEKTQLINSIKATAFSSDPFDPLANTNWNLKNFARHPQSSLRFIHEKLKTPGVLDPMVFLGMLWSYTYWNAEPGHLYRIDYHHCGAPKTWYGSPSSDTYNFEKVVKKFVFPQENLEIYEAYDILSLRRFLFSPSVMVTHGVPIYKIVQFPGEFVVTFPRSYHMHFSHGFNCWESVNFATPQWFPFGDEASDRCAHYNRTQEVPFEKIMFKEFMHIYKTNKATLDSPTYRSLKVTFICFIRMYRVAMDEMKEKAGVQSDTESKILACGACSRECYLAYIKCDCYSYPLCIFHDIYKECPCKDSRLMVVRDEFLEFEAIAKKYEVDEANKDKGKSTDKSKTLLHEVDELYIIKEWGFNNSPYPPITEGENVGKGRQKGKQVSTLGQRNSRATPLVIRDLQAETMELSVRIPKKPRTRNV